MIKKLPDQNYVVLKFLVEFISLVVDRYVLSLTFFQSWIWVIEILIDYRCNRCSGYLMPMLPNLCWCYDRQQKITKNIQVRHEQDDRRQPCCCLWSQSCLEQRQNHGQSSFSMRFNNLISILKIKPFIWLFRSVSVMIIS